MSYAGRQGSIAHFHTRLTSVTMSASAVCHQFRAPTGPGRVRRAVNRNARAAKVRKGPSIVFRAEWNSPSASRFDRTPDSPPVLIQTQATESKTVP